VQALMASPLADGLFRRAIIMSAGSPLSSLGGGLSQADAEKTGLEMGAAAGAGLDRLYEMSAADVLKCAHLLKGGLRFRPCVDKFALVEDPGATFRRGAAKDFSLMIGSVTGDAALFMGASEDRDERAEAATVALAKRRIAQIKPGCYVYHFRRDVPGADRPGAFHSSELWYVFGTLPRSDRPFTGLDYDLSLKMADWWTNFARTGSPGGGFSAYTAETPALMEIGEKTGMVDIKNRPLADMLSDEMIRKLNA
jgi:para-nitrobenzyl esterase